MSWHNFYIPAVSVSFQKVTFKLCFEYLGGVIKWEFIERLGKYNTMWMRISWSLHFTMQLVNSALVLFVMVEWPGYFSMQEIVCYTSICGYFHSFLHVFLLVPMWLCVCICVYLKALEALMQISEGDMRKAVMFLQSASRLCGQDDAINLKVIMDITGVSTVSVFCWTDSLIHKA